MLYFPIVNRGDAIENLPIYWRQCAYFHSGLKFKFKSLYCCARKQEKYFNVFDMQIKDRLNWCNKFSTFNNLMGSRPLCDPICSGYAIEVRLLGLDVHGWSWFNTIDRICRKLRISYRHLGDTIFIRYNNLPEGENNVAAKYNNLIEKY